MAVHGFIDVLPRRSRRDAEFRVQRVECESPVCARRRTRSAIADLPEVIGALAAAVGKLIPGRQVFWERPHLGQHVVQNPMSKVFLGRVGIIADQRHGSRASGYIAPLDRWRNVFSIACVFRWNRFRTSVKRQRKLQNRPGLLQVAHSMRRHHPGTCNRPSFPHETSSLTTATSGLRCADCAPMRVSAAVWQPQRCVVGRGRQEEEEVAQVMQKSNLQLPTVAYGSACGTSSTAGRPARARYFEKATAPPAHARSRLIKPRLRRVAVPPRDCHRRAARGLRATARRLSNLRVEHQVDQHPGESSAGAHFQGDRGVSMAQLLTDIGDRRS